MFRAGGCKVPTMGATRDDELVDFPSLARELGWTRRQREDVLEAGVVSPVVRGQGRPTKLTQEDADKLLKAAALAALGVVGLVIALRLVAAGVDPPA
jgi:hypothetical protein